MVSSVHQEFGGSWLAWMEEVVEEDSENDIVWEL